MRSRRIDKQIRPKFAVQRSQRAYNRAYLLPAIYTRCCTIHLSRIKFESCRAIYSLSIAYRSSYNSINLPSSQPIDRTRFGNGTVRQYVDRSRSCKSSTRPTTTTTAPNSATVATSASVAALTGAPHAADAGPTSVTVPGFVEFQPVARARQD